MFGKMRKVLLDFERMQFPFTGFYYGNLNFGRKILRIAPPNYQFGIYLKPHQFGIFGDKVKYEDEKSYQEHHRPGKPGWLNRIFPGKARPKYDIVHISDQHSKFEPAEPRSAIVLTVHDLNYLVEAQDAAALADHTRFHQRMLDKAGVIVCISDFVKQCVLENLDVKGKPVHVIYQGCEIEVLPNIPPPDYKPLKPFLFTISNMFPKKNVHTLPCLLKNNDYELVISGMIDHPAQQEYMKLVIENARMHGVADRVRITGPISDSDRQWYYQHCEAFLFPSLAEGFGLPPLEAMRFGKPVFASTATSVPEICGDAAYYFKSFEPEDMQETYKLGMKHYREHRKVEELVARYNFFSWDRSARAYLALYEEMSLRS